MSPLCRVLGVLGVFPWFPPVGKSDTQALLAHLQPGRSLSRVESDMIGTVFVQRQQLGQLADLLATWTLYEYIVGRLTCAGVRSLQRTPDFEFALH